MAAHLNHLKELLAAHQRLTLPEFKAHVHASAARHGALCDHLRKIRASTIEEFEGGVLRYLGGESGYRNLLTHELRELKWKPAGEALAEFADKFKRLIVAMGDNIDSATVLTAFIDKLDRPALTATLHARMTEPGDCA